MAGTKNLKPVRTKEEAKERGHNGGVKSGETRRRKRDMKSAALLLLDMGCWGPNMKTQMEQMGIEESDMTNQMAVLVSMLVEAQHGSVRAAEFLRDTAGRNNDRNRDYRLRQKAETRAADEFEYRKQKEAGIEYEIEDLDDIEETIYGSETDEQIRQAEDKPEEPAEKEDDPV